MEPAFATGTSPKREREYEELKRKFQQSGRYGKRAPWVAARIVNKQRAVPRDQGRERGREAGEKPDRNLPLGHYRHLTIAQLKSRLKSLSKGDVKKVKKYEENDKALRAPYL